MTNERVTTVFTTSLTLMSGRQLYSMRRDKNLSKRWFENKREEAER